MSNTYRGNFMVGYILSKKRKQEIANIIAWYFIYKTKYENVMQF